MDLKPVKDDQTIALSRPRILWSAQIFLPLRLVVILGLSVFVIELGIMWLLPLRKSGMSIELLDAGLLTALVAPVLYLALFRPLNNEILARKRAEIELLRAQAELELKVKDRTAALTESLEQLHGLQRIEHVLTDRQDFGEAITQASELISKLLGAHHTEVERGAKPMGAHLGPNSLRVPLLVEGEPVGHLTVVRDGPDPPFTLEDARLARMVADRLAAVVENERLRARERERAAAEERERLARDLHDAVTQSIYSASLLAEALPAVWERSPVEGRHNLERLRLLVRGSLAEMRSLLFELRPSTLEKADLAVLLERLGDALAGQLQIPVRTAVTGLATLPVDVKVAFYRLVQEAFSNIGKHSRAGSASAVIEGSAAGLSLEVLDDGCGFDSQAIPAEKMGLRIMRERAHAIGASLAIRSAPGRGTAISVFWPAGGAVPAQSEEIPADA